MPGKDLLERAQASDADVALVEAAPPDARLLRVTRDAE